MGHDKHRYNFVGFCGQIFGALLGGPAIAQQTK